MLKNDRHAALPPIALLTLLLAGCQAAHFRAASMPDHLRVAPMTGGGREIQLASLAAQAASSTALTPGDLLEVRVLSGIEDEPPEPMILQVAPTGEIDVPLVGPVAVAGLDPPDASRRLAHTAVERGVYRRPNVTLEVKTRATHRITVIGAVDEPGVYPVPIGACNVLTAIAAAGGRTEEAGTKVQVMRQASQATRFAGPPVLDSEGEGVLQVGYQTEQQPPVRVQRIDLAQITRPGQPPIQQDLGDGDIVFVGPREAKFVHVTGLVTTPDRVVLPVDQDLRVLDAVAMAGGVSTPSADKVFVIRQPRQGTPREDGQVEPAVIQVSLARAKLDGRENLILGPGDLVSVESTPTTRVADAVRDFFRVSLGLTSTAFAF